jgi:hypothetical protein
MHSIQLGWQPALALSAVLATGALATPASSASLPGRIRPYLRESALVAGLYGLWQLAGSVSVIGAGGAFSRARWIERFERGWLPSERDAQRLIEHHALLVRAANWYYAGVHFAALGLLLVWLFARHRDRYPRVRTVLVLLTCSCLLIQLVPVAPPRLLPDLGFVDTAARYGESVYAISGITVDQLSAMPSVHVGWALLVAWAAITVSSSRYRWWVLAHPVLTIFVVAATANHFWLDGIVAGGLLVAAIAVVRLAARLRPTQAGMDDGDSRRPGIRHGGQRVGDLTEADHAGDELVGRQPG